MTRRDGLPEAWVAIPTEEEHRAQLPPGAPRGQLRFRLPAGHGAASGQAQEHRPTVRGIVPASHVRPRRTGPPGAGNGGGSGGRSPGLRVLNRFPRRVSACRGRRPGHRRGRDSPEVAGTLFPHSPPARPVRRGRKAERHAHPNGGGRLAAAAGPGLRRHGPCWKWATSPASSTT